MTDELQRTQSRGPLDRTEGTLGRLARTLLRHRKVVGLLWMVVAVVGIALVGPIAGRLTSSGALPGLPSYQAGLAIMHTYGNGGNNTPIVAVATLPGTVSSRHSSRGVPRSWRPLLGSPPSDHSASSRTRQ